MSKGIRRYLKDAFYADQAIALLRRIEAARQGAIGRTHGEALHDWRVVGRRLLEFTRLWAPRDLRRAVRPVAAPWIDATNAARDAEVEQGMIDELRKDAPQSWAADLERLEQAVAPVLRAENEKLGTFLADPARAEEERQLEALFAECPCFPRIPRRLPRRLRQAIEKFQALHYVNSTDLDGLHALRLATKRLRYGLEPLAPLAAEVKPVLAELTALQRALGEHRDWSRLAEKSRAAGIGQKVVAAMEKRAAEHLATRPPQLKATEKFLTDGWSPPHLAPRVLRRRVLREAGEDDRPRINEALKLASKARKCQKRPDGVSALVHPLRAALSLAEEAGMRGPEVLTAALIGGTLTGCTPISEDELAERFGAEAVGAAMALDPGEEPPAAQRERLAAGRAWVRTVALALALEELRYAAEAGRGRREIRAAAQKVETLLPLFERQPDGAAALARQAARLVELVQGD